MTSNRKKRIPKRRVPAVLTSQYLEELRVRLFLDESLTEEEVPIAKKYDAEQMDAYLKLMELAGKGNRG